MSLHNIEIAIYVDFVMYVFGESLLASKLFGDGAVLPAGLPSQGWREVASLQPVLCFANLRAIAMPVPSV